MIYLKFELPNNFHFLSLLFILFFHRIFLSLTNVFHFFPFVFSLSPYIFSFPYVFLYLPKFFLSKICMKYNSNYRWFSMYLLHLRMNYIKGNWKIFSDGLPKCPNLLKISQCSTKCLKYLKCLQIVQKSKMINTPEIALNCPKMPRNCQKCIKCFKYFQIVQNVQNWQKVSNK